MKVVGGVGVGGDSLPIPYYLSPGLAVNEALDDKRTLIGEVYGQEGKVYVPFHNVHVAYIMEQNVDPPEVEDDTCVSNSDDCSVTTFCYDDPEEGITALGDTLTVKIPFIPGTEIIGFFGIKGDISADEPEYVDVKSITSSDPSVASVSVEQSEAGFFMGLITRRTVGETVVTTVLTNGCSHTVKITVVAN